MIAGQRWSAATKSDRIALLRDLLSSAMIVRLRIPAERAAPRREPDDGEQEIGGLRRIGTTGGELRRAFRRDEAGVAMLPSVELAVEEGTAVPSFAKVGRWASTRAMKRLARSAGLRRPRLALVFRRHLVSDSHSTGCGGNGYIM